MDPEGTRLLTLVNAYGMPHLHHAAGYSRPLCYMHCAGSIVVTVQCQVLNRQHETNFDNYSLIRKCVKNLRR